MSGEVAATAVPRPVRCDLTKLSIDSGEAFFLSQVDGRSTLEDLAAVCGMSLARAERVVVRLVEAGAVELPEKPRRRGSSIAARAVRAPTMAPDAPGVLGATLVPRVVDRAVVGSHAVDAREAFVIAQIDGRTPIEDIVAVTGVSRFDVSVILTPLLQTGALELDDPRAKGGARGDTAAKPRGRTVAPRGTKHPGRHTVTPRGTKHPPVGRRTVAPAKKNETTRPKRATVAPASKAMGTTRPRRLTEAPREKSQTTRPKRGTVAPGAKHPTTHPRRATMAPKSIAARHATRKSMRPPPSTHKRPVEDDTCELDPAVQARVDAMLASMPTSTLYALLGVPRDAPKKAIKRAYFELAAVLHPDRQFRKKLGPYKAKLHDLFVRVTAAHDTLVDATTRAMYDRTLPTQAIAPPPRPPSTRMRPPSVRLPPVRVPRSVPPPVSIPRTPPPPSLEAPKSRRSVKPGPPKEAPEALLRFFAAKVGTTSRDRVRVFVDAAQTARDSGNFLAAAQNYELALQACETPEIRAALDQVSAQARDQGYAKDMKAAASAERDLVWDEAVRRYGKAYDAIPTAHVADRLANAIRMQPGGDLRRAVKMADDAVVREPNNVAYRLSLGNLCADAGLWLRAKGEAERLMQTAPKEEAVKALAARVKGKG